jgi:hypothetical protein
MDDGIEEGKGLRLKAEGSKLKSQDGKARDQRSGVGRQKIGKRN